MRAKTKSKGINLLPREYIQVEQAKRMQIIVGAVVLLETCLFIGTVVVPPKVQLNQLEITLEQKKAETLDERFVDVNKTIEELEIAKQEVNDWVAKYGGIKTENFIGSKILDSLTSRTPAGLVIDSISIIPSTDAETDDIINISCTTPDSPTYMNYITIIESMYGRGTVSYTSTFDEETDLCTAEITVNIPHQIEIVPVDGEVDSQETGNTDVDGNTEVAEGGDNQ